MSFITFLHGILCEPICENKPSIMFHGYISGNSQNTKLQTFILCQKLLEYKENIILKTFCTYPTVNLSKPNNG